VIDDYYNGLSNLCYFIIYFFLAG
ncbi:uncharacterized protein METZ01_LOCUS247526, partial [marine metagenome]